MKYFFSLFLLVSFFAIPALALAQKPTKVDSAQSNVQIAEPPKEDEPSQDDFIEVKEEPKPLQNIQSLVVYPEKAKREDLEGRVSFSMLIGKDGNVRRIVINHADDDIFRKPVIDAMQKVRFSPAKGEDGKPIMVWYAQSINFKLLLDEDIPNKLK